METYKIITDQSKLEQFIDWLPDLDPNEIYYISLLARSKYCKDIVHIKSDVQQCKRFTTTKERMIDKIRQLECPIGAYKQNTTVIPQEALAIYIHPNPRSQTRALQLLLKNGMDLFTHPYSNYNVHQVALSAIQQSPGEKVFVDFDYDHLSYEEFADKAYDKLINADACSVLKTRGGFHVLVTPEFVEAQYYKTWYIALKSLIEDENVAVGDLLIPIPGCIQGNFTPRFLTIYGVEQ